VCQVKEWLRFTLIVSTLSQILRQMTEICCRLGCDTVQYGSLINVSEASTKEAVSSDTLVPTSQKSVLSKEIFVNLRRDVVSTERDVVSTERKDAYYTNSINLSTFAPINFHYRLQKKKNNPCTGPQGSRRLRLPDFQAIGTRRCQQIRLAELKCSSLQRRYLTTQRHST
jgi:hypothetical protein